MITFKRAKGSNSDIEMHSKLKLEITQKKCMLVKTVHFLINLLD